MSSDEKRAIGISQNTLNDLDFQIQWYFFIAIHRDHPAAFETLTTTDLYFWDKGHGNLPWEMDNFYKISKHPILR